MPHTKLVIPTEIQLFLLIVFPWSLQSFGGSHSSKKVDGDSFASSLGDFVEEQTFGVSYPAIFISVTLSSA